MTIPFMLNDFIAMVKGSLHGVEQSYHGNFLGYHVIFWRVTVFLKSGNYDIPDGSTTIPFMLNDFIAMVKGSLHGVEQSQPLAFSPKFCALPW